MAEIIDELENYNKKNNDNNNNNNNQTLPVLNDLINLNEEQDNNAPAANAFSTNEETEIPNDDNYKLNNNPLQVIKLNNENQPLKSDGSNTSFVVQVPTSSDDIEKSYKKTFPYTDSTLNEPISTTILRDLFLIFTKIKFVANPFGKKKDKDYYIKQWDLWGPLLLNILLACTLAINSKQKSQIIILVFVIFWLGGVLIYLNANFLGMKTSIFQLLCLFGYCLFPLNLSAIILLVLKFNDFLRLVFIGIACFWSIYASSDFLKGLAEPEQRYLVLYPCILYYIYIAWFIFTTK